MKTEFHRENELENEWAELLAGFGFDLFGECLPFWMAFPIWLLLFVLVKGDTFFGQD